MIYVTDFHAIGLENHASRTMSNNINHFISTLVPETDMIVKDAGGNLKVMGSGTLRWRIEDDDGKIHTIICKDAIFVPNLHTCLLSPQHWAQGLDDNSPKLDGTWCATYADRCVIEWNQRKHRRTIRFDRNSTNTRIIYLAPGCDLHRRKIDILNVVARTTQICQTVECSSEIDENNSQEENISAFLPNKVNQEDIQEKHEINTISPASELLRWYHILRHLSFVKMKILIILGILPKKLLTVKTLICASCKARQIVKKSVRVKGANRNNNVKQVFSPGECVSVDQSELRTPGFIGVLKGFLKKKRYTCATIFVDHYSGYTYIHMELRKLCFCVK